MMSSWYCMVTLGAVERCTGAVQSRSVLSRAGKETPYDVLCNDVRVM